MEPTEDRNIAWHVRNAWRGVTGKSKWAAAAATVETWQWRWNRRGGENAGYYDVTYSYSVDGTFYNGKFTEYGSEREDAYERGDSITIRYDPSRPSTSYYPDVQPVRTFHIIWIGIAAVLGILVVLSQFYFAKK